MHDNRDLDRLSCGVRSSSMDSRSLKPDSEDYGRSISTRSELTTSLPRVQPKLAPFCATSGSDTPLSRLWAPRPYPSRCLILSGLTSSGVRVPSSRTSTNACSVHLPLSPLDSSIGTVASTLEVECKHLQTVQIAPGKWTAHPAVVGVKGDDGKYKTRFLSAYPDELNRRIVAIIHLLLSQPRPS